MIDAFTMNLSESGAPPRPRSRPAVKVVRKGRGKARRCEGQGRARRSAGAARAARRSGRRADNRAGRFRECAVRHGRESGREREGEGGRGREGERRRRRRKEDEKKKKRSRKERERVYLSESSESIA